jgi:DNA-binding NarL/FixJ family response regulator
MVEMVKVVVAEDQVMVREGIRHILERDPEIRVVGGAKNGREALRLCEENEPDLVLMDLMMPECDGIEGTRLIKEKFKAVKVIILTTFNDDEMIVKALNNGADGYMLKEINSEELIMTVKSAALGLSVIHRNTLGNVARQIDAGSRNLIIKKSRADLDVTGREIDIIRLLVDGKDNKVIASELFLSEGSVKNTISALLKRFGLKDRIQLAVFAVKNDIV